MQPSKRRARRSTRPLLEDSRIRGSRGILINITGSSRLGLHEVNEACSIIREAADCEDVQINFGVILNESLEDAVKITVIATGFQPENEPKPKRPQIVVESHPPAWWNRPRRSRFRSPNTWSMPRPSLHRRWSTLRRRDPCPEADEWF